MTKTIKRGFTYPFTIENGTLSLSSDRDLYRQAIFSVLETRPWERVMQGAYGTPDLAFFAQSTNGGLIAEIIHQTLDRYIPQLENLQIASQPNETGLIQISISWSLNLNQIPQPALELLIEL